MMSLIFDLIRRRWGTILFVLSLSALLAFYGIPVIYAPLGLILLVSDAQRGAVRVIRTLPVNGNVHCATMWIIGVPLGVLMSVVVIVGVLLPRHVMLAAASDKLRIGVPDIGSAILIQSCFALIIAAVSFLALSFSSNRSSENWRQLAIDLGIGVFWGTCIFGGLWQGLVFPYSWGEMKPWHWALLGAGPFIVAASYKRANIFILRRSAPMAHDAGDRKASQKEESGRVTGIALYLCHIVGRAALVTILIGLLQYAVFFGFPHKGGRSEGLHILQIAIFGVLIGAFMTDQVNIRGLRILPISTTKLTLLLLGNACTMALVAAAFPLLTRTPWDLRTARVLQIAQEGLVTAGVGAMLIALFLWFPGRGHLWVALSSVFLVPWAIGAVIMIPSGLAFLGGALLALSYFLIFWGLRHSHAFYRLRPIIGVAISGQR